MTDSTNGAATGGIPRIGDKAPDFRAVTTTGEITFSEWARDSWVILFSHPADFTPVCSTELLEFARREDEFTQRNTKLIGLSIDSIHSHLAWRQNLIEKTDVAINYPLIADLSQDVANRFGMVHPAASTTAAVRAVFVIDPKRTIRALVYYPLNVGRQIDEVIRLLDGLQTTDQHGVACPVNWTPGEKVIVPPPRTNDDVAERLAGPYERVDFYLARRDLPAS